MVNPLAMLYVPDTLTPCCENENELKNENEKRKCFQTNSNHGATQKCLCIPKVRTNIGSLQCRHSYRGFFEGGGGQSPESLATRLFSDKSTDSAFTISRSINEFINGSTEDNSEMFSTPLPLFVICPSSFIS